MKLLWIFTIGFMVVYLLLSIPTMLGFGLTIDFIAGANPLVRDWSYLKAGLFNAAFMKSLIAALCTIGILLSDLR